MEPTNLLHVDTMTGTAEDQASLHRFGKSLGLEAVSQNAIPKRILVQR